MMNKLLFINSTYYGEEIIIAGDDNLLEKDSHNFESYICEIFETYNCANLRIGEKSFTRENTSAGRRKRIALMQPHFLPWIGYFELLNRVDLFIILDDFQFSRQGWGHRNRLSLTPGSINFVTLPIRHPDNQSATYLDIQPAIDGRWLRKFETSIKQVYGRSELSSTVLNMLIEQFSKNYSNIADLETEIIKNIANMLGIQTGIRRSSELRISTRLERSGRIVEILRNVEADVYYAAKGSRDYMIADKVFPVNDIDVYFQDHQPIVYPQPSFDEFIPKLSIVDALLRLPPAQVKKLLYGTPRWINWNSAVKQSGSATDQFESELQV